jgi:DNA replication protein DnaC
MTCDHCDGLGWEPVMQLGIRRMRRCEACDYWVNRRARPPVGLPVEEAGAALDAYKRGGRYEATAANRDALHHAQLFVQGIHAGLYVFGTVGCGKTALACAVLNDLAKAGTWCRFVRVPELLKRVQPGSWDDSDPDGEFQQLVERSPVLCLDDVGANQGTDYARRTLQTVFDLRQDRGFRTIWTSNLDLDDLGTFLDDARLPSRIAGAAKVIELDGPDYRLKKAQQRQTESQGRLA